MQSPNGIGAILLPHIHKASDRHYTVRKPHGRLCAVGLLCRPFSKRRLVNLPFNCGTKGKDIECLTFFDTAVGSGLFINVRMDVIEGKINPVVDPPA